jgi:hypothetical protein
VKNLDVIGNTAHSVQAVASVLMNAGEIMASSDKAEPNIRPDEEACTGRQ